MRIFDPEGCWRFILRKFDEPGRANIMRMNMALKWLDGMTIINDYIPDLFFQNNALGTVEAEKEERKYNYKFAYRQDTGFVLRKDNPELYEKIETKAGKLISIHLYYDNFFINKAVLQP